MTSRPHHAIAASMLGALPESAPSRHGWRAVIAVAVLLSFDHSGVRAAGARTGAWVTPLSWLPDAWIFSDALFGACHVAFLVGAALWTARRAVPYSSWVTALGMTLFVSLYHERRAYVDHIFQMINVSLWVLAWWAHVAREEWRRAEAPRLPAWVVTTLAATLGLFYTMSGVAKLHASGLGWANGVSLQAWVSLWGRHDWVVELLTRHRGVAAAMQATTLAAELLALPALLHRRSRWLVGGTLLSFHAGQQLIFGWEFYGNMALLGLFYLPILTLARPGRPIQG